MTKKLCLTLYICGNHQTGIHVHVTTSPHVAASWLTHNMPTFFVLISISNHHENKSGSIALSLVKIL